MEEEEEAPVSFKAKSFPSLNLPFNPLLHPIQNITPEKVRKDAIFSWLNTQHSRAALYIKDHFTGLEACDYYHYVQVLTLLTITYMKTARWPKVLDILIVETLDSLSQTEKELYKKFHISCLWDAIHNFNIYVANYLLEHDVIPVGTPGGIPATQLSSHSGKLKILESARTAAQTLSQEELASQEILSSFLGNVQSVLHSPDSSKEAGPSSIPIIELSDTERDTFEKEEKQDEEETTENAEVETEEEKHEEEKERKDEDHEEDKDKDEEDDSPNAQSEFDSSSDDDDDSPSFVPISKKPQSTGGFSTPSSLRNPTKAEDDDAQLHQLETVLSFKRLMAGEDVSEDSVFVHTELSSDNDEDASPSTSFAPSDRQLMPDGNSSTHLCAISFGLCSTGHPFPTSRWLGLPRSRNSTDHLLVERFTWPTSAH